jgi:hypothetical protein
MQAIKWIWKQEMAKTEAHVVYAYMMATGFEGLSAEGSYRFQTWEEWVGDGGRMSSSKHA